jgi:hypothetical protein
MMILVHEKSWTFSAK